MDGSDGSMHMVKCKETFPKPQFENKDDKFIIPFTELPGEGVKCIGNIVEGILALTNYRIFVQIKNKEKSVPVGLIDSTQIRDLVNLYIFCKDGNYVKCIFETSEKCLNWHRRISGVLNGLNKLEALFAFPFYAWNSEMQAVGIASQSSRSSSPLINNMNGGPQPPIVENEWTGRLRKISGNDYDEDFRREVDRLQFNLQGAWRISRVNEEFKLCPSYPRLLLVPIYITDEALQNVATFRSSRRIPVAVWRNTENGAVIARCSQPEVGWLGWRNAKDEELLQAFVNACAFDRGTKSLQNGTEAQQQAYPRGNQNGGDLTNGHVGGGAQENECASTSSEGSHEEVRMDDPKKMLIVDARSYTSAVTNRARGGGCECIEYYPSAEIEFMNLGNIHAIRKSFHSLRHLCSSSPDMNNWLSTLEKTAWLQHLSGLLAASMAVCRAAGKDSRPVLVHCSDGWDRTPQIVATAQLCLDPYYRTVEGFRTLVEKEWLSFGHKFADRCGHGPCHEDGNERCPVFIQWLDCIHQLHLQHPCSFEFSMGYLIKLAQHSHSCLFGTFLGNTFKERLESRIFDRTYSVWPFLSGPMYKNPLYVPNNSKMLWIKHNVRDLSLWNEVFLEHLDNNQNGNPEEHQDNQITRVESVVGNSALEDERMVSLIEDGVDEGNGRIDRNGLNNLNIEIDEDPNDNGEKTDEEPTSPMSKTRSYGDLLKVNGCSDPQRRSSDPTVPVELLKYSPNHPSKSQTEPNYCDMSAIGDNHVQTGDVLNGEEVKEPEIVMPKFNSFSKDENNFTNNTNLVVDNEAIQVHSSLLLSESINSNGNFHNPCQKMALQKPMQSLLDASPDTKCSQNVMTPQTINRSYLNALDDEIDGQSGFNGNPQMNLMLESVDLRDTPSRDSPVLETALNAEAAASSLWHGSIETSTDTLVPVSERDCPATDLSNLVAKHQENRLKMSASCSVEETLHSNGECLMEFSQMNINRNIDDVASTNKFNYNQSQRSTTNQFNDLSQLNDIIQTQPTSSGNSRRHQRRRRNSSNSKSDNSPNKIHNGNASSATNSSRFSTPPGARSLPLTPPGGGIPFEKGNVAISCPDGLAHALSEQNLRLQQIIYEHKLREEALQRELNATKMELLNKQMCYYCNNSQPASTHNDEQNNNTDGGENVSVSSWEAVEERGAGSGASSANNSCNGGDGPSKVLWVPDHAVNKCTECSVDFWLVRRKHHCRSCGKIFCSECSEFFAPLPDERLYNPVRLCGKCYHAVTTKIQQQHLQQQQAHQMALANAEVITKSACFSMENPNYCHHKPLVEANVLELPSTSEAVVQEPAVLQLVPDTGPVLEVTTSALETVFDNRLEEIPIPQQQQPQMTPPRPPAYSGVDMACKSSVSPSSNGGQSPHSCGKTATASN